MKITKTIELVKEGKDLEGIIIPKGTRLFVILELPKAPFGDNHRLLKVRVDNGTGILKLMPETVVRDTEIKFKDVKK